MSTGGGCDQFAIAVKVPIQAVGVDQVRQRGLLSVLLVFVVTLHPANADVQVLGLDMPNDNFALVHDEIRRPAFLSLGFVQGRYLRVQRREQGFKGGPI